MKSYLRLAFIGFVTCLAASSLNAATIIKLNLGGTGPDVSLSQTGAFGTSSDGNAATNGDQNTAIEYTGGLDFLTDINPDIASFTLSNLQEAGFAMGPFGNVIIQDFTGGTFD